MTELKIQLFGSPGIHLDQEPVTGFVSSKATALVYYLAATNRTHSRESLATLFWADVPDAKAKKNLRDILSNLRKVMGPYLDITRQTVTLNAPSEAVDTHQLMALLSETAHTAAGQEPPDMLKSAAARYVGEFLEGFYVADAPLYEEWVLTERERYGQLVLQLFNRLITDSIHSSHFTEGIDYALRALALSPLEEATHRHLMTLYAATGQYATALEQYEQCCQLLYDEFGAEPSDETTSLFESIQTRQENPAAQMVVDEHWQPFVGRAADIAEISRLLASSDCRLLTLAGLGGIGKSRLATQIAIQHEQRFLDGTYLVPVGLSLSLEQFVAKIATVVGLSLSGDEDAVPQLLDFVQTKSMLIIIDNAEVLLQSPDPNMNMEFAATPDEIPTDAVDLLGMMVESAPGLKVIATSREYLGLRSEWVFDVGGLTTPALRSQGSQSQGSQSQGSQDSQESVTNANVAPNDEALQSDSVQLFLRRARQNQVDFAPNDSDLTQSELVAIGHICHWVGGIPLAIELAAGWVTMLSCREIMHEVVKGTDLLASTARDLPERHRSIQAIFDHSWQMLTADEQEILKKLAVFQGGFSRKALQQIGGASLLDLQKLMRRSFLTRSGKERFELHNLVQQYALQKLGEDADSLLSTQEAHAYYFSQLLVQHRNAILSEQLEVVSIFIDAEMDNLRAAYDWALGSNQLDILEAMLDGLYHIYGLRSWLAEGITRFHRTAEIYRHRLQGHEGHKGHETNGNGQLLQERLLLGKLSVRLGRLFQMLGRHDEAQKYLTEGSVWAESTKDLSELGLCRLGQANVLLELARYTEAEDVSQQSLELYQQLTDPRGTARALYCLGKIQLATGNYSQAKENLSESLGLAQVNHLNLTEAECLGALWKVCWNQGENVGAQRYLEDALALFRLPHMANQLSEARVLNDLGFVAWSQGLFDQAQAHHTQALMVFRHIGNRQGEGKSLSDLGRVAERRKDYPNAAQLYKQAVVINREIQDRNGEAISIANLGFAAYRQGDFQHSEACFTQCEELCHAIGFRRYQALSVAWRGLLACFRDSSAEGVELSQKSIDMVGQIQDPLIEAYGWVHLGYAFTMAKKWDDAASAYRQGLQLRKDAGDRERLLDPISGLAIIAYQQDDLATARNLTDELLMGLNEKTLASAFFSAQIHYVCYATLDKGGEPEAEHYRQIALKLMKENRPITSAGSNSVHYQREPLVLGILELSS